MEARRAHNPKVVGSNPTPATNEAKRQDGNLRGRPAFSIGVASGGDLRVFLQGFLLDRKVEGLSPRTIDFYQDKLGNFLWYCEQNGLTIADIDTHTIREFLAYLKDTKHRWESDCTRSKQPLSPRTIQHYYGCLRTFFNWLVTEEFIEHNPVLNIKQPKAPKKVVRALTPEELQRMLVEFNGRDFDSIRNRAITMLFVDTGLRLSELGNITLEDINLDRQTILIIGKGSKQRMVRFGSRTAKAIWKYLSLRNKLNGHSQRLWLNKHGYDINADAIACLFKRLADRTGIKIHSHKLRHTYAISALRNGMNPFILQASLGHSTLEMTRRYCQSLGFEDVYKAHITASPIDNIRVK